MSAFITRGDHGRAIKLTAKQDGEAVSIDTATFETRIPNRWGGYLQLDNAAHTQVEAAGVDLGRVNLALTAAQTQDLPLGKNIRICTKVTLGAVATHFWGIIPEVRDPV